MFYLLFSLAGILLIVVLNQWLGTWFPVPEISAEDTIEILEDHHAGIECGEVSLSADNRIGLAQLADGRFGLVRAMADNYVTRIIDASNIAAVRHKDHMHLMLSFNDLTLPPLELSFTDSEGAERWQSYLRPEVEGTRHG